MARSAPIEAQGPKDRILVIAPAGDLADQLRRRYPEWEITTARTHLSGIAALCDRAARAVVVFVDAPDHHLPDAMAGLREAGGEETRLLLCCPPEAESAARSLVRNGSGGAPPASANSRAGRPGREAAADDYILYPLQGDDLDRALQYSRPRDWLALGGAQISSASAEELAGLGRVLGELDREPTFVLRRTAELLRTALAADWASVAIKGAVGTCGESSGDAVLAEPLVLPGAGISPLGQITLGPRPGRPYTGADAEKLRQYAALVSQLLDAAARHRRWRELAYTDELSGLPNRRYLLQFLDEVLRRAAADRFRVTLLLFDVDDFKSYNDACGHEAGDEIIRLTGRLFRQHCREHDVVTRFGGDEFAVVFWDAEEPRQAESKHPHDAMEVLQRFTRELGAAEPAGLRRLPQARLTISGGLATFPWDANTREDLLRKADEALLAAKRAGKNRIFTIGQPG